MVDNSPTETEGQAIRRYSAAPFMQKCLISDLSYVGIKRPALMIN
jgi:hypothetical protein